VSVVIAKDSQPFLEGHGRMSRELKALIIDKGRSSGDLLRDSLAALNNRVSAVERVNSLPDARRALEVNTPNAIFIDPVGFGLKEGSQFVFNIRKDYPNIPFVLYFDFDAIQPKRENFYAGERKRFKHYYKLNKATPASMFRDELVAVVKECQGYLAYYVKASELRQLQTELNKIEAASSGAAVSVPASLLTDIRDQMNSLNERLKPSPSKVKENTVFLSYRFVENDYVEGLRTLLEKEGFSVVTGEDATDYISRSILERIGTCEFFLCLMTRDKEKADGTYTTSPWLLEEKGAALALNKKIVLMVEDGISEKDVGGLQADWQRIHFSPKGFTKAALRAIDQLKRYVG
jgi:hypothetical protein